MRWWWEVARRGFRRYATYRAATLAGVFTNTVFGFIRAYVLLAVFRLRADVGGYDAADAVTFAFLTQGMIAAADLFGAGLVQLGERIRSGDIATDLYRPVDFQAYWLGLDAGRAAYHALARGLPPILVGAVVFDLRLPAGPAVWAVLPLSVGLAVLVSFGVRFVVGLSSFWLLDVRGPAALTALITMFFSGFAIPLVFFPGWLRAVAESLPFHAIVQVPLDVYLGHRTDLLAALVVQVAWAAVLLGAGRMVLAAAERKVVVQGG